MPLDFSGQNLKGRSFKNRKDLTGANFSYADIRGADFTGAILIGANFSHAKAGIQYRWIISLVTASLFLAALTGFVSGKSGIFASSALSTEFIQKYTVVPAVIIVLIIVIFFLVTIRYGLTVALANLAWILSLAWILVWMGAKNNAADWTLALALALGWSGALAWCGAFAEACVGAWAWIWNLAGVLFWALAGAYAGKSIQVSLWILAAITAWALTMLGNYLARRGFAGEPKFAFVRSITIVFGAIGGTNFQRANLTDANFAMAMLQSTDLRNAVLTRTCWLNAQKLDRARVGESYLKYPKVQQLLITGVGQNQNFDDLSLQGINLKEANLIDVSFIGADLSEANLQGANLVDVSFIGANLSEANLQDANLSRAKLVQTQLDGTNFTGATLTGAYIEDWGITSDTKFNGVRCEYVYMRLPTKENPDPLRKPDNREEVFADGEFGDFIKPIVDTLDLYHNQGVDPRAIAISFKQLAENHPEAELEIVAMEKRGRDKFLLRAKTAETADKSELSAEYFATYNQMKGLPEREIKLLLAEKENQIRRLENMVMTALERPSFYSNVEQVGFMTNNPSGISQNMSGGTMHGGMQAAQGNQNQQSMESHVTASNEKQLTKEDVVRMLAQIEQMVESTPELPQADKEKSLRYLGAAKEEAQATEPDKQFAADNLKRAAATLKTTSETVATTKTLWENVKPVLKELPGWLGVAKTFFGF